MAKQVDTPAAKSEEYRNFEEGLKQILSVPKQELERRLQVDKDERAAKKRVSSDTK